MKWQGGKLLLYGIVTSVNNSNMRPNLRMLLGGLLITSAQMNKDMRRSCVVVSNPQKRNSTKKVKNKKSGGKQVKYSSTKPIKSKATSQFRNKSNI